MHRCCHLLNAPFPPFLTRGKYGAATFSHAENPLASSQNRVSQKTLQVRYVPLDTRAVLDAVVDAAISAGIADVVFEGCFLTETALPALTRLLLSPGFERLNVSNDDDGSYLIKGPALPAFCDAVRNCKSLKTLELESVYLWDDMAAASQLIAALEGLPALHKLDLSNNYADETPAVQRAAGECLARLIARNASLRDLDLSYNHLGEAGLEPFFQDGVERLYQPESARIRVD